MSETRPAVGTLGVPRDETHYELKAAFDAVRAGCLRESRLAEFGRSRRVANWRRLKALGVDVIPSNDFSFLGPFHETAVMVGLATPLSQSNGPVAGDLASAHRHRHRMETPIERAVGQWFGQDRCGPIPRLLPDQDFARGSVKPVAEFLEARFLDVCSRPVLVGPVSFLAFAGSAVEGFDPLDLLPRIVPIWRDVLEHLRRAGAEWVEIDEPGLAADHDGRILRAIGATYPGLAEGSDVPKILLTIGSGDASPTLPSLLTLPVAGLHLDLVNAPDQLDTVVETAPAELVLSLGVVDGANARRTDLSPVFDRLERVVAERGAETIELATSCSLGRLPFDSPFTGELQPHQRQRLAFAADKISELTLLAAALAGGRTVARKAFAVARRLESAWPTGSVRDPRGRRLAAE